MDACPTLSSPPLLPLPPHALLPSMSARRARNVTLFFFFLFFKSAFQRTARGRVGEVDGMDEGGKESLHRSVVAGNTVGGGGGAWNWDKSTTCAGDFHARERGGIRKFATLMPFKTPSYERGGTGCAISERGVREGRHTIGGSAFAQGCNTFPNLWKKHVGFEIFGECMNFHNFSLPDHLRFCKWNEEWTD